MREHEDRPQIIGSPPTTVKASYELDPDTVAVMLQAKSAPRLLSLLGMRDDDREQLLELIPKAVADAEILQAVTECANQVHAEAGLTTTPAALGDRAEDWNALQGRIFEGQGLIPILGLTVGTATVRAWHEARGMSIEQSWEALADLGQQMHVHRATFGDLGLHQYDWVAENWAGRHVWLGRLQFDVHRAPADFLSGNSRDAEARADRAQRWVIGVHIPATGPLDPTAADESFAAAREFFRAHYADLGTEQDPQTFPGQSETPDSSAPEFGTEFVCDSWLLSPELPEITGKDSNLSQFAARFDLLTTTRMDDATVFFVFNKRPPYEVSELPADSRLRRGVIERLRDGRGWHGGIGRLVLADTAA